MLILSQISKKYSNGLNALDHVDLTIAAGSFTSIVGPSGCGKSTLLRMIAGLDEPTAGSIVGRPDEIGLVFQDATLMPWTDVEANVYLPLRLAGVKRADAAPRIAEALALVGLADFAQAYPRALSGGMRMRVAIARALVTRPRLLLMDEPFAALDEITRNRLNDDLLRLWREQGFTVVFITHSVFESVYLSTDVAVMTPRPGRMMALHKIDGPPVRDAGFRASTAYLEGCRAVSHDLEQALKVPGMMRLLPLFVGIVFLAAWEFSVRWLQVPVFVLPPPTLIVKAFADDFTLLMSALWVTVQMTLAAFLASFIGGLALAILFSQSKLIERSLLPYAIVLQVTPIVSIAPIIVIWVGLDHVERAVFILATIVAFFPILSNATLGLRSVDPGLSDLFRLYRANRWQRLFLLQLPSALPALLAGARISGGLALIGSVVAEFVAGSGEATGLAWRIAEAGQRLEIPKLFAGLFLLSLTGLAINFAVARIEHMLLRRWHPAHGEAAR